MTIHRQTVDGWERGFGRGMRSLLGAAAASYRGLLGTREMLYARGVLRSRRVDRPVVSIGNLTVGGTGKTPAVELAVRTLTALGHSPAVVSRGYTRQSRGVQIVADAASIRLDAEEAGDEPFLLARRLPGVPVVVGGNRHEAAREAVRRFSVTAIVLDDGFQHRTLVKDLEIVTARARMPWGNGRLLPAGPLREPLVALGRADVIVVTGARDAGDVDEVAPAAARYAPGVPICAATHAPTECWDARAMRPASLDTLRDLDAVGFAGIANPAGFRHTLAEAGARLADWVPFADHYWYTREDLDALERRAARRRAAALVTTEKDWVRLRRLPAPSLPLYVLSVRLVLLSNEDAWQEAFRRKCPKR